MHRMLHKQQQKDWHLRSIVGRWDAKLMILSVTLQLQQAADETRPCAIKPHMIVGKKDVRAEYW